MAQKKKPAKKTRAETIEKRMTANKKNFLKELEKMPIIGVAASKIGVGESTVHRWKKEDINFRRLCADAMLTGKHHINDVAVSKVIAGIYNDNKTYVIFWLKHNHIDFSPKLEHRHEHNIDNILTNERMKEIADAVKAWSQDDEEDNEEYIVSNKEDDVD